MNIKSEFKNVYLITAYSLKEEDTKLKEIKGNFEKAQGNLDTVVRLQAGQPEDPYIEKMKAFMAATAETIAGLEKKLAGLFKTF